MSYEKRKKQRLKKKKIQRILVICFFVYLIFRSFPIVIAKNSKTILAKEHTFVESKEVQGALIMEETVFTTVGTTDLKEDGLEGKRIPAGYKVADVNTLSDISTLKEELEEVEEAISILSRSDRENEIIEKDKEEITREQEDLIKNLKDKIDSGDYSDVNKIKNELLEKNNKITEISPNNTLINQSLESLNKRKDKLLEEINKNNLTYATTMAGMLSYKIDGYEKLFIPKEFENYTYENLNIPNNFNKKDKREDFKGFKIINNFEWYVALKIDNIKEIKNYEVGNNIVLDFLNDQGEIKGTVVAVNSSKDKMVLVVKFTTNLEKYYTERFPNVSIIMSKQDVYKLPTKALVDKEGQIGVYIKEFNGIVKFKPLSIIVSDKDYTYVDKGNEKGFIEVEGYENPVKTITLYDEIFVNPSNIKEGQILD